MFYISNLKFWICKDLPFIKKAISQMKDIPKWLEAQYFCKEIKISFDPMTDHEILNDNFDFYRLYIPSIHMGPDGLLHLFFPKYLIVITWGVKISSSEVSNTIAKENFE